MAGRALPEWARLDRELTSFVAPRFVKEKFVAYFAEFNKTDMTVLRDLLADGKIKPVIDRTFPFTQVPDAVRYLEQGHARGKVVVVVSDG